MTFRRHRSVVRSALSLLRSHPPLTVAVERREAFAVTDTDFLYFLEDAVIPPSRTVFKNRAPRSRPAIVEQLLTRCPGGADTNERMTHPAVQSLGDAGMSD